MVAFRLTLAIKIAGGWNDGFAGWTTDFEFQERVYALGWIQCWVCCFPGWVTALARRGA